MKLWPVKHFWFTFFPDQCWFSADSVLIWKKSEPKVFNWSEFHSFKVTSYKIHTLETARNGGFYIVELRISRGANPISKTFHFYLFANSKSKQILIRNGTQLLFDFEDLKVLPALMIDIHSEVVDICKIVPQVKKFIDRQCLALTLWDACFGYRNRYNLIDRPRPVICVNYFLPFSQKIPVIRENRDNFIIQKLKSKHLGLS